MQILCLDTIDSTQKYLKKLIKEKKISLPYAVVANKQTDGVGSRDNSWKGIEGNLFLSFAIELKDLPKDLKLESASIYFSYILKETLSDMNSKVWLKWPNDFYIESKKIGGMITNIVDESLVCGVGINIEQAPDDFGKLDIKISTDKLINKYFKSVEKKVSWKQVFRNYKLEFHRNQDFSTHEEDLRISLKDARLQSDGSIIINDKRVYSLR